jgi:hypothetical protein
MNAISLLASRSMRVLSPRMLPPERSLLGSTASTDAAPLADQKISQHLDEGALARPGDAGDADANGIARPGQAGIDDLLGQFGVFAARAFNQRDGAGEHDAIAAHNAFDALGKGQAAATAHARGPYVLGRLDAGPNKKSFIPRRQSKTPFQSAFRISVSPELPTGDIPFILFMSRPGSSRHHLCSDILKLMRRTYGTACQTREALISGAIPSAESLRWRPTMPISCTGPDILW